MNNMDNGQNMRIYGIIEQLEDAIENSPRPKIGSSAGKRIVEIAELNDVIGDLKVVIPEDIRRANSVLLQAESMINDAAEHARELVDKAQQEADAIMAASNEKSEQILSNAKAEYERLVSEDEIYQEAQRRAKLLAQKAEYSAGVVFENAKCYADDVMGDLDRFLAQYRQQVSANRSELGARVKPAAPEPTPAPIPAPPSAMPKQPPMQTPAQAPVPQPSMQQQPMQQPMQQASAQGNVPVSAAPVFIQPGTPASAPGRGRKAAQNIPQRDDQYLAEDEDFEAAPKKSIFAGLFKSKKKAVDDDDFDDDFE